MRTVETLIEECINHCQGQSALAARIGVSRQALHSMATGAMPVSPATVALLCNVLTLDGSEARRLAALAIVTSAKPERREALHTALFRVISDWTAVNWGTNARRRASERREGHDRREK